MPYKIEKKGSSFVVINSNTGKVHGNHPSKEKATKQLRLLYGIENGMKVKNAKS